MENSPEFLELGYMMETSKMATSTCVQKIDSQHVIEARCNSTRLLDTLLDNFNVELISTIDLKQNSIQDNNRQNKMDSQFEDWLKNIDGLTKSKSQIKIGKNADNNNVKMDDILKNICQDIQQNSNRISLNTVKYIQQLTSAFRNPEISANDVEMAWKNLMTAQNNNCDKQRKKIQDIFVDAILTTLNEKTWTVVRDELLQLFDQRQQNVLGQERLKYLSKSLAFAPNPSFEAVKNLVPEVLNKIKQDADLVLSISALVKDVQVNSNQKENFVQFKENIYKTILEQIFTQIDNKTASGDVIRLLQAVENIAPRTEIKEQEKLISVIKGNYYEPIRSFAIKSIEAVRPTNEVRQILLETFSNTTETNEIRIASYRTLLSTGTNADELENILAVIQKDYDSGDNLNVYNYVSSHQKVLRNTIDTPKRLALPKDAPEFPDPSSTIFTSKHYELTNFDAKTSFGFFLETDVIMEKAGWSLPSVVSFNFTLPVGNTDNQISVGRLTIRQESNGPSTTSIMKNIIDLFPKLIQNKDQSIKKQIYKQIDSIFGQNSTEHRIQLMLNIDGKNIFVYDSQEPCRYTLQEIYESFKDKLPIKIDETIVIMPWQKRVSIQQTSSGVPMYLELNSTYIGSLEANIIKSMEKELEVMIKPTIVLNTNLKIGNDELLKNQPHQFHIVNQMLIAPTIHFHVNIKDDQQIQIRFMFPDKEQTIWRSQTKLGTKIDWNINSKIQPALFKNNRLNNYDTRKKDCSRMMMNLFGVSICYRNMDGSINGQRSRTENSQELITHYSELTLQKETKQMEALEMIVELPFQLVTSEALNETEDQLRFVLSMATIGNDDSNRDVKFKTEAIVNVPTENNDQLKANFTVALLRKEINGHLLLVDNKQRIFQLEANNEKNRSLLRLNVNELASNQMNSQSNDVKLNFDIFIQPCEEMKAFSGKGNASYQQNLTTENFELKLEVADRKVLDIVFVKNVQDKKQQMQLDSKLNMENILKIQNQLMIKSDSNQIHSTSKTVYNQFWSKKMDQLETLDIEIKSVEDRVSSNEISALNWKREYQLKMISSQFSRCNVELSYNGSHHQNLKVENFLAKFGKDFDNNQFQLNRTTNYSKNEQKSGFKTEINVKYKPMDQHYMVNIVGNATQTELKKKQIQFNVQIEDRTKEQTWMDSKFKIENFSLKPFQMDTKGEIKFFNPLIVINIDDRMHEANQGTLKGQSLITTSMLKDVDSNSILVKWMPSRVQIQYLLQTDKQQSNINCIGDILRNLQKFDQKLFVENDHYGHCGHLALFEKKNNPNSHQQYHLKGTLRCEGDILYDSELKYNIGQQLSHRIQFFLDTTQFRNTRMNSDIVIEKDGYNITANIEQNKQNVLSFETHQDNEEFHVQTKSKLIDFNLNLKKTNINETIGDVEVKIPKHNIQHNSMIMMLRPQSSIQLDSQTIYRNQNLLKFQYQSNSILKQLQGKFGNNLQAKLKLENINNDVYQLSANIEALKQKIFSQCLAKFEYSNKNLTLETLIPIRLISMDIKNHVDEQIMLDVNYKQMKNDEYRHQMRINTKHSDGMVSWSDSKASIDLKTKHFGGMHHQMEINEINLPSMKFISTTQSNNFPMVKIVGDLNLKNGQRSTIEVDLNENEHNLNLELILMNKLEVKYRSKNGRNSLLNWNRLNEDSWTLNGHCENRMKLGSRMSIQIDHQCEKFTKLQIKSSKIRGQLEHRIDRRSIKMDLNVKDDEKMADINHQMDINWDKSLKKIQLKSKTNQMDKNLILIEVDYIKNQLFQLKSDSDLKRFPLKLDALLNYDQRHINFEIECKNHKKHFNLEAKTKNWNDFRVDCSWGLKTDNTKRILGEFMLNDHNRTIMINAQLLQHQIKVMGKRDQNSCRLQSNYSNLQNRSSTDLNMIGQWNSELISCKLELNSSSRPKHFVNLEWKKPERQLQINVYNEQGRLVDLSMDVLAKSAQKKFQIASFIDTIPSINAEATFGENPSIIFELSLQKEKKMQISLNWFGQWRKDYRAEVSFQCFTQPQFELLAKSHHPANFDSVDMLIKFRKHIIKANLVNKISNETNDNQNEWKQEADLEIDGRKALHMSLEWNRDDNLSHQTIYLYNANINGDYSAKANGKIIVSSDNSIKLINLNFKEDNSKHYLIELFCRYPDRVELKQISGIIIDRHDGEPIFKAIYLEPQNTGNDRLNSEAETSMILLLPGHIEYQLVNKIKYGKNSSPFNQIENINSKLLKNSQRDTLADINVSFDQENNNQTNVIKVEVRSDKFSNPKMFKVRYTIDSVVSDVNCARSNENYWQIEKNSAEETKKCSSVQLILGDDQLLPMRHQKPAVSLLMEYVHDNLPKDFNQTMLFSIDTLKESDPEQTLNFTTLAHVSLETIGYKWENINRYGNKQFGQFHFTLKPENKTKWFDIYYRYKNEDFPLKNIHLDTKLNIIDHIRWIISDLKPIRLERYSQHPDLIEWRTQPIESIKDELRHKWRLFKRQALDRELLMAIIYEVRQTRYQMRSSQDPLARKIIDLMEKFQEKLEDISDRIDIERLADQIISSIHRLLEGIKDQLKNLIKKECYQNEQCRALYKNIRNYELLQLSRKSINNYENEYIPRAVMRVLNQLNSTPEQLIERHLTSDDRAENILNIFDNILEQIHSLKQRNTLL